MEAIAQELREFRHTVQCSKETLQTLLAQSNQDTKLVKQVSKARQSLETKMEAIAQELREFRHTVQCSNETLQTLLAQSNQDTKLVKQVSDMTAHIVEMNVNYAIKDYLENGELLVGEGGYIWNLDTRDELDGLVTGVLNGVEVIVFVKSKTSIASMPVFRNAKEQLLCSVENWIRVRDIVDDFSAEEFMDYQKLEIVNNSHRSIVLAYGALNFPVWPKVECMLRKQKDKRMRENKTTQDVLLVTDCPRGQYAIVTGSHETARG